MTFSPDIVATESGSSHVLLVVEAKTSALAPQSESQLKRYMWEMSCPTGIFVSPRSIVVFRNMFTDYSDDSVRKIGEFPAPESWRAFEKPASGIEFESRVQSWLERLNQESSELDIPKETMEALSEYVIPSLSNGEIRAAGPRLTT